MAVNIFTDRMQHAELFGKPVLTTNWLIPRETVPDGWFCYDMLGTGRDPGAHAALVDCAAVNHSGTVLSPTPLKRPTTSARKIGKRDYFLHGEEMDLEGFCEEYGLDFPENPIKFEMQPASPNEAGSFYALPQMGLTAKGLEMLQAAADPSKPHEYCWYVIENINDAGARKDHELPLKEAIQLYAGLDCADKRLGVTKDDIASVDLVILHDGREWLSKDYRKSDSFAQDPVVAEAVDQIWQTLEGQTVEERQDMTMGGMAL